MLRKIITGGMLSVAFVGVANAKPQAVVNKNTCAKMVNNTKPFILVLNSGDDLLESITQCAREAKLSGASISGVGQLQDPTLAFDSSNTKAKPTLHTFPGLYKLGSLNGKVAVNGDKYFTHAQVALGYKQYEGFVGRVDSAKVGKTAEITVVPVTGNTLT